MPTIKFNAKDIDAPAATGARAEVTSLSPVEETKFKQWAKANGVTDVDAPESHYDYRGYWKDVASKGGDQRKDYPDGPHFPDTYKQHGHPTFSVESKYSRGPDDGGRWEGETFVPPSSKPNVIKFSAADIDKPAPTQTPAPEKSWTADYPKTAQAVRLGLDALPGIGALAGGVVATPTTLGAGSIAGAALGAGAGRGLRDLLAEAIGVDVPTTPEAKAGRIALDTVETGVLTAILPGIMEAVKTPGRTVRDVVDLLPPKFRPFLPKGVGEKPAGMLQTRPLWQVWEQADNAATEAAKRAAPPPAATRTGTAWQPSGPIVAPTAAGPVNVPRPPAPVVQPPAVPIAAPAAAETVAPVAKALSPAQTLNELALAARRAKITLSPSDYKTLTKVVQEGTAPADAVGQLLQQRLLDKLPGAMSNEQVAGEIAARVGNRSPTRASAMPSVPSYKGTGSIKAFHASPEDFGKFSFDKATEGRAGTGHYFSQSKNLAADSQAPGAAKLYEVEIQAHPNRFLDENIPLAEQSKFVQEAVKKSGVTPDDFGTPEASIALRNAGIPGIKYIDEGVQNYVVFDDDILKITKRTPVNRSPKR